MVFCLSLSKRFDGGRTVFVGAARLAAQGRALMFCDIDPVLSPAPLRIYGQAPVCDLMPIGVAVLRSARLVVSRLLVRVML